MKRKIILMTLIILLLLSALLIWLFSREKVQDDLVGSWEVEWSLEEESGQKSPLLLYIHDLEESGEDPNRLFAAGCMQSRDTQVYMPLTLEAIPTSEGDRYQVTIYSSIVPQDEEPFVIRLQGEVDPRGRSLSDDDAAGTVTTVMGPGEWRGIHNNREISNCPSEGYAQFTQGDVRFSQDLAFTPPESAMILEVYTPVVSNALRVTLPDGSIRVVETYTDIFSPDVDFISQFRYFEFYEGEAPVSGEPYQFVLLDIFGDPIQGTGSSDVFWRCTLDAPRNQRGTGQFGQDLELSWDPVTVIPGEFDPAQQIPDSPFHLPYQISISPVMDEGPSQYGALTISNWHVLPWESFEPGGEGAPDGVNFGQPISSFSPGLYQIMLDAWNMAVVDQGGHHQDCEVHDSSEALFMEISDTDLSFTASGVISGLVATPGGDPIPNIWVNACVFEQVDNPFCQSAQTNSKGEYQITRLFPGGYRVNVWGDQGGWLDEFYNETQLHEEAERVGVEPGGETMEINFTMEPAE